MHQCWSVGKKDSDCQGDLCCFNGCENVCYRPQEVASTPAPQCLKIIQKSNFYYNIFGSNFRAFCFCFDLPKFSPVNSWLLPKHGRCIIGKMRLFGWFSNTLLQPMVARNSQVEAIRLASKIISPIAGAPVNLIWIVRNRDFVALTVVQIVASSLLRLKTWTIRPNI